MAAEVLHFPTRAPSQARWVPTELVRPDEPHQEEHTMTLPETILYDMQPYTYGAVLTDLRWEGEYNGHPLLRATVQEGTQRSFLFGQTSARDIAGQKVTLYGVTEREIKRGRIVRVAS